MKRLLSYTATLVITVFAISIFIGAPSQKWDEIKAGMKGPDIAASIGSPKNNLLESNSLQIWEIL